MHARMHKRRFENRSDDELGTLGQLLVKFKCTIGRLAGVLLSARALVHLNVHSNWIKDDGAGLFAGVLAQCPALAHLDRVRVSLCV